MDLQVGGVDEIEMRLAVGLGLATAGLALAAPNAFAFDCEPLGRGQALRASGSRFGLSALAAIFPSSPSSAGGKWIRLRPETFAA